MFDALIVTLLFYLLKGLIIKSTGSWYSVLGSDGVVYACRLRGKFRLDKKDTSNPIAVGDIVVIEIEQKQEHQGVILELDQRKNHIIRKSNKLSAKRQTIAANVDVAVVVASLVNPRTSLGFIDRFLVCCECFHIQPLIFFNKVDLLGKEGLEVLKEIATLYQSIGYAVLSGSAFDLKSCSELEEQLSNKTSLFVGHSGVGKSSLLKNMFGIEVEIGAISAQHKKGKHTTTFAEMHFCKNNSRIIDTPGIRDFGLVDLEKSELNHYFPEFKAKLNQCKFHNCCHINEPDCAIVEAVNHSNISQERYNSYLSMYFGEDIFE